MNNLNDVINNLANKLGVAAEQIYPVLIAQARVSAIQTAISLVIELAVIFAAVYFTKKAYFTKRSVGDGAEEMTLRNQIEYVYGSTYSCGFASFVLCLDFLALLCLVAAFCDTESFITAVANPEFWALDYVLGLLE